MRLETRPAISRLVTFITRIAKVQPILQIQNRWRIKSRYHRTSCSQRTFREERGHFRQPTTLECWFQIRWRRTDRQSPSKQYPLSIKIMHLDSGVNFRSLRKIFLAGFKNQFKRQIRASHLQRSLEPSSRRQTSPPSNSSILPTSLNRSSKKSRELRVPIISKTP